MEASQKKSMPAKKATKKASKPSNKKSIKKLYSEKIKLRHTLRREKKHMNTRKLLRNKRLAKTRKILFDHHITLLIHGANTDEMFTLPPGIEVVTFTLAGRPLWEKTAFKIVDTLRNKYDYYKNRSFNKIKSRFFSVTTSSSDTIRPQVYNNEKECPNYPIEFIKDILSPVQKIFDPQMGRIVYSNFFKTFLTVEGVLDELTQKFYDTLPEVGGTRSSTLKDFVTFIKENLEGNVRIFYLGCAGGDVGPHNMEQEPEKSFKNFSLNSPNHVNQGMWL